MVFYEFHLNVMCTFAYTAKDQNIPPGCATRGANLFPWQFVPAIFLLLQNYANIEANFADVSSQD